MNLSLTPTMLSAVQALKPFLVPKQHSLFFGNEATRNRGSGVEFQDFRPYFPGDDIRHLSWAATLKTGRPTVKTFVEDREVHWLIALDTSSSTFQNFKTHKKLFWYSELAAVLAIAALSQKQKVGFASFSDKVHSYLGPQGKVASLWTILQTQMHAPFDKRGTDIRFLLEYLDRKLRHPTRIILLSDFFSPPFESALQKLTRKHEVLMILGYDSLFFGKAAPGIFPVWDPESGKTYLLDFFSKKKKQQLSDFLSQTLSNFETLALKSKASFLALEHNEDTYYHLVSFFHRLATRR